MERVKQVCAVLYCTIVLSTGNCQELFRFKTFGETKPFKRGKEYEITWTGGVASKVLTFQLLKGGAEISKWANVANTGSDNFVFPSSLKPGKDYTIDVSDKNGLLYRSNTFSVARKIPLALKFSPLAIAGIVALILPKNDEETTLSAPTPP